MQKKVQYINIRDSWCRMCLFIRKYNKKLKNVCVPNSFCLNTYKCFESRKYTRTPIFKSYVFVSLRGNYHNEGKHMWNHRLIVKKNRRNSGWTRDEPDWHLVMFVTIRLNVLTIHCFYDHPLLFSGIYGHAWNYFMSKLLFNCAVLYIWLAYDFCFDLWCFWSLQK